MELITGWNLHEGTTFMLGSGHGGCHPVWNEAVNPETFVQKANQSFGADATAFLNLYPHSTDGEAKSSAEGVVGDLVITWPTWKWAELQSRSGKTKTYVYLFGKRPPAEAPLRGATHGSEVPYAFDNLQAFKYSWDSMDAQIARTMSTYYANFAKSGNPNGPGLPLWPVYHPSDPQHMVFDENGAVVESLPLAKLHLIDANQSAGPWCPEVKP